MVKEIEFFNLDLLRETVIKTEFFPYMIVPNFINKEMLAAVHQDFPKVPGPGSYPRDLLEYGENFRKLLAELEGPEFRSIMVEKFGVSLEGRPTLVTVRGQCHRKRDGHIHSDTKSKILSILLYLNPAWESDGGRLRLLHDRKDIENVIEEVPPLEGTLLAFKVSDNSWHGHKPFQGERRVIQLNYVVDAEVVEKELARHRFSAKVKKITQMIGL